jgi:hypothetical protein
MLGEQAHTSLQLIQWYATRQLSFSKYQEAYYSVFDKEPLMEYIKLQTAPARKMMCLLGALLGVLFSPSLFAQANFGRILGTVTDQTGAVLPGATVSVIDTQRGLARTLTADREAAMRW